jgi:ornithine cyclodeaminase
MIQVDDAAVAAALDRIPLIEALNEAFKGETIAPPRPQYSLGRSDASLLLMPAWNASPNFGVKLVTVFPRNASAAMPAVNACYVLFDAGNGSVRAIMDGNELTLRRTSAASALASRYLSRSDSTRLLMVGTGALAPHLIESHCRVRPIDSVRIWGRTPAHAERLAERLSQSLPAPGIRVEFAADLGDAAAWADIISCATLARDPLIRGIWLRAGQHIDLVGSFNPSMREADTLTVKRASVFVDVRASAIADSGEIVQALNSGDIGPGHILADLHDLTRKRHAGRRSASEITLFKSVGHALEDLAAAQLVLSRYRPPPGAAHPR